ncbi:MAG: hypothetical protein GY679_02185 [Mycoplasma sp.]|nr:hypothetical protein [Mycoplasma sp.]
MNFCKLCGKEVEFDFCSDCFEGVCFDMFDNHIVKGQKVLYKSETYNLIFQGYAFPSDGGGNMVKFMEIKPPHIKGHFYSCPIVEVVSGEDLIVVDVLPLEREKKEDELREEEWEVKKKSRGEALWTVMIVLGKSFLLVILLFMTHIL